MWNSGSKSVWLVEYNRVLDNACGLLWLRIEPSESRWKHPEDFRPNSWKSSREKCRNWPFATLQTIRRTSRILPTFPTLQSKPELKKKSKRETLLLSVSLNLCLNGEFEENSKRVRREKILIFAPEKYWTCRRPMHHRRSADTRVLTRAASLTQPLNSGSLFLPFKAINNMLRDSECWNALRIWRTVLSITLTQHHNQRVFKQANR